MASQPVPTVDLLAPIAVGCPSGRDLRETYNYTLWYKLYRSMLDRVPLEDSSVDDGDQRREPTKPDAVIEALTKAISEDSKDLQLAAWLAGARTEREGLAGLAGTVEFLAEFLEQFWQTMYPPLTEADGESRRAILLSSVQQQIAFLLDRHSSLQAIGEPAVISSQTEAALVAVRHLNEVCTRRFHPDGEIPGFDRVQQLLVRLANRFPPPASSSVPSEIGTVLSTDDQISSPEGSPSQSSSVEPAVEQGSGDLIEEILKAAAHLREQAPENPIPYLVVRAVRLGELSAGEGRPAPETKVRLQLETLVRAEQWPELLECAEGAASGPPGRACLDIHRYGAQAAAELGFHLVAEVLAGYARLILEWRPELSMSTLDDGTAAANPETSDWIRQIAPPRQRPAASQELRPPETETIDVPKENGGRTRFERRLAVAHKLFESGKEDLAVPVLQDLVGEIDARRLEDWEAPDFLIRAPDMLRACLTRASQSDGERAALYARICRMDPDRALELADL